MLKGIESKQSLLPSGGAKPDQDEHDGTETSGPSEGVTKYWTQARLSFLALRQQFPDIGATVRFIENSVDYAPSMTRYQKRVIEQMMDHPGDTKYLALVGGDK